MKATLVRALPFLLALTLLPGIANSASVIEHFRAASLADDFGPCNAMLVRLDFTGDEQPELLLSHYEHRAGGVHIWHVYTPQAPDVARYLGTVQFHPRGLRAVPDYSGFVTYAGDSFKQWRIDDRGLHADADISQEDPAWQTIQHAVQRCPKVETPYWQGPDEVRLPSTVLTAHVINGADELARAATEGDVQQIMSLLDDWVTLYAAENAGGQAITAAATAGRSEALHTLFDQSEAHPPAVLRQAIRAAAWHGRAEAAKVILAQSANDTQRLTLAQEALGLASQAGMVGVIPQLLQMGANPNLATSPWEPRTPLELATAFNQDAVVKLLTDYTAPIRMSPAQFGKYADRFAKMIRLPKKMDFEDMTVRCGGWAFREGTLIPEYCLAPETIEYAIVNKIEHRRKRIIAADVKGRRYSVWFQFTVHVRRDETGDTVSVYPNHGHSVDRFGTNYVAPQRYRNGPQRSKPCPAEYDMMISGLVKRDGTIDDVTVVDSDTTDACNRANATAFAEGDYIPAHHDGEAVEARLFERFYSDRHDKHWSWTRQRPGPPYEPQIRSREPPFPAQ